MFKLLARHSIAILSFGTLATLGEEEEGEFGTASLPKVAFCIYLNVDTHYSSFVSYLMRKFIMLAVYWRGNCPLRSV